MPVLEADIFDDGAQSPASVAPKPFGLMLEALDDLRPNEVYVATGGSFRYGALGRAHVTRARYLRAAGAVLNGFVRDAAASKRSLSDFPAADYTRKTRAARQVIDFRVGIEIEGSGLRPAISSSATARASSSFPPKWRLRRSKRRSKGVDREPGRNRHPPRHGRAGSVRDLRSPVAARLQTLLPGTGHDHHVRCGVQGKNKANLLKKPQFMPYNSLVLRQTDHLEVRLGLRSRLHFGFVSLSHFFDSSLCIASIALRHQGACP